MAKLCCDLRKKIIITIFKIQSEAECGIGDIALVDAVDFELKTPCGRPVLRINYCPWCGKPVDKVTSIV